MARRVSPAVAAMVLASLLWGATFVVIRDTLASIDAGALVAARFGVASLLWLGLLPLVSRARPLADSASRRTGWIGGLASGPCMAAGYLFQAIGLETTSAGSSAFLTSAGSLLAAPLAWLFLGQRPSGRLAAGLLLAMVGSALLGIRGPVGFGGGEAWTLLGSLAFAAQIVVLGRWAARAEPLRLATSQSIIAAAILFAASPAAWRALGALPPSALAGFVYLVVAGSLAAPLLQVLAQRSLPPGRIGLLFALEPVFALGFALTWGQERFVARWWSGAMLILAGVLIVETRAERRSPSSRAATGAGAEARSGRGDTPPPPGR